MNKQEFHERHPYLFVIILEVIIIAVALLAGTITFMLKLPEYVLYGITMVLLTIITALYLWKMDWWKRIGFQRLKKKYLILLIIPVIPLVGNLFGTYTKIEFGYYIYYFMMCIMVGFVEEGMYRGLMLQVMLKKGVWKAVMISSFLFSLTHIMNALAGWSLGHVLIQLLYSFAIGFGWSAFTLRTKTIWPLMTLHFFIDFFSFIKAENIIKSLQTSQPDFKQIIYSITVSIVFIIYGIVVIRSYIKEKPDSPDHII